MTSGIGLGISIGGSSLGGPSWASGVDLWRDFVSNSGNLSNPGDTHAQTIYAPDTTGLYLPFTANVLTRTDLGLQTVPTRTNYIRNNTMVGASAGVFPTNWSTAFGSGITKTPSAPATENGINYIDVVVSGTTGDANGLKIVFEPTTGMDALTAEVWTLSAFVSIVGGDLTNISQIRLGLDERDAAGVYVAGGISADFKSVLTTSLIRNVFTRTLIGGATVAKLQPYILISCSSGVAVSYTIRIGWPQAEKGSFATPPIVTTGAAVTVNGNQQVISGLGTQLAVGVAGIWQGNILNPSGGATDPYIFSFSDGSANNTFNIRNNLTNFRATMVAGGAAQSAFNVAAWQTGIVTIAFAASTNFVNARIVGQSDPTADTVATYPAMDSFRFTDPSSNSSNMYQQTRKLALKFGPQDASTFDAMYQRAVLAAAA